MKSGVYIWLKNKTNIKKTYGEKEVNDSLFFDIV